jgi:DNA modification methylase
MNDIQNGGLIWHTEKRTVDDLIPNGANPRTMSDKQMSELKRSLKKYNLVEIPAIDSNNTIISGHQRLKALQLLGRGNEEIDVRVPNRPLTKAEYDEYLIASNAISGDWDFEALKSFDLDMLLDVGFEKDELLRIWDFHLEAEDDDFDVEKEKALITEPVTKLGDLIELGPHRILCGDAIDEDTLKRLFGNDRASMIYSDAVYNISVDYNAGIGGKQSYGGNVNDTRTFDEYRAFLLKSLECALSVSHKDTNVFYWCDQVYIGVVQDIYRELGIANKRVCLWIKNGHNPTPGVAFNKCYEPCVYGVRGKPFIAPNIQNLNEVMNKEMTSGNNLHDEMNDLWTVKRLAGKDYSHATSKPPKLHEKAIRRCSKPGDIILDSFLGSGSTLIAAEQLKRRVYGTELEPVFCDLIMRRYEALTGIKAKITHTI